MSPFILARLKQKENLKTKTSLLYLVDIQLTNNNDIKDKRQYKDKILDTHAIFFFAKINISSKETPSHIANSQKSKGVELRVV
jgi:hypothetical protein